MKQESFLKSFVTIGAATVVNMIIGFLTAPIITRIVDPLEYGQFSIFTMYTGLATMVLCLGMDQSLVRFFYKQDTTEYKRRLIWETLLLPLGLTLLFLAAGLLLIRFDIITFEFNWLNTVLLAVNILLSVIYRFTALMVRLNHNNKLYGVLQVMQKGTYVAFALLFLLVLRKGGVFSLCLATVLSIGLCFLISVVSQKKYYVGRGMAGRFEGGELHELLRFGFPYIFSMGITALFQSLDKMSLNLSRTYSEVGVYASAMTFISLFGIIQTSFNTVWAPKSVEHYEKNPEDRQFFKTVFNVMSFLMFGFGIALILFKDLFAFLLGAKYREAAYIMPFLIFSPIMYTISETTVCGINFAKRSVMHIYIAAGACMCNFLGNTYLVPILGCRGAAISTGMSYIIFFLLRTIIAERLFHVGFNLWKIAIITIVTIGYAAYNTFFAFGYVSVLLALVCYGVLLLCYWNTMKWCIAYAKKRIPRKKNQ